MKGRKVPLEPYTYIQKRKFRLGTREEVGEIQTAKRTSGYFSKTKRRIKIL